MGNHCLLVVQDEPRLTIGPVSLPEVIGGERGLYFYTVRHYYPDQKIEDSRFLFQIRIWGKSGQFSSYAKI